MEYRCNVCGQKVKDDVFVYIDHTEDHIIEEIKVQHPDWEELERDIAINNKTCPQKGTAYIQDSNATVFVKAS